MQLSFFLCCHSCCSLTSLLISVLSAAVWIGFTLLIFFPRLWFCKDTPCTMSLLSLLRSNSVTSCLHLCDRCWSVSYLPLCWECYPTFGHPSVSEWFILKNQNHTLFCLPLICCYVCVLHLPNSWHVSSREINLSMYILFFHCNLLLF